MNATSSTAAAANSDMISVLLQPSSLPRPRPSTSTNSEGQRIGVNHPLEVREAGAEALADGRQRDVDDRDVEQEHERRHAHRDEGPPLPRHEIPPILCLYLSGDLLRCPDDFGLGTLSGHLTKWRVISITRRDCR